MQREHYLGPKHSAHKFSLDTGGKVSLASVIFSSNKIL